jgi:hypothetical protein
MPSVAAWRPRDLERTCNRAVTTAGLLALEPSSDPFSASPGCTGVHLRSRLYTEDCAENGVPELGSEVQVLASVALIRSQASTGPSPPAHAEPSD